MAELLCNWLTEIKQNHRIKSSFNCSQLENLEKTLPQKFRAQQ